MSDDESERRDHSDGETDISAAGTAETEEIVKNTTVTPIADAEKLVSPDILRVEELQIATSTHSPQVSKAPVHKIESESASYMLFEKFDVYNKGFFGPQELKAVVNGLRLFPRLTELKAMIKAVDTNEDGFIDFDEFRAMRCQRTMHDLYIISEFKRLDASIVIRGSLTADGIKRALQKEGATDHDISSRIREIMALDSAGTGKVSFSVFYNYCCNRVPDEWLEWIYENIMRGVTDYKIIPVLLSNGFSEEQAASLINATREGGRQMMRRNFVDLGRGYVYTMSS
ncbi:EF-hand domain pair [Carpediemonas membranifera]|uniref:EF-hand domain pair n=1 Tax=Carpediemonas membranifera TaxID=201153 RepID=A0A8J6B5R1_9EUKA|nr:EF-hand domain pair [Carpediemonas membranifera]|eukprot:KAG9393614.1 EF-hand domain pair [Carpediemonas membranifera]